jgi:protein-serine/threonine kinase
MIPPVCQSDYSLFRFIHELLLDYEQQRLHLLHKHGIDLEDSHVDGKKTKRMDRREVELLMGGGDGQGGLFTWREKNRRKVTQTLFLM